MMSNHLSIATVTAALGHFVHTAADASIMRSVDLNLGRPTAISGVQATAKVHVYLYQVSHNASLRNDDLPTRGPDGNLVSRPQAALDLRYLIAFYGDQQKLEPDCMLGAVVRDLHARPLISRRSIQDALVNHPELNDSDLVDAIEQVRLTPAAVSLDELSKVWSVFFQTPYALSVVYDAKVVLIEAEESGPRALPVLRRGQHDRGVEVTPNILSPFPALESIHIGVPEDAGAEPLPRSYPAARLGACLILSGSNFTGDDVEVEFRHFRFSEPNHPQHLAPKKITVPPQNRTPKEVRVQVPIDNAAQTELAAGPYMVSVKITTNGKEYVTNMAPLFLAPQISNISPANPIVRNPDKSVALTITVTPKVMPTQTVTLLLENREIQASARTTVTDTLNFDVPEAPIVTDAVVRLRIDGVDSMPFTRVDEPPPSRFEFDAGQKVTIHEQA